MQIIKIHIEKDGKNEDKKKESKVRKKRGWKKKQLNVKYHFEKIQQFSQIKY